MFITLGYARCSFAGAAKSETGKARKITASKNAAGIAKKMFLFRYIMLSSCYLYPKKQKAPTPLGEGAML
jgi:hypothetical protein